MILITRPRIDAEDTAHLLSHMGLPCLINPMLEVIEVEANIANLPKIAIFTSANGVRHCPREIIAHQPLVFTVGGATANEAHLAGFKKIHNADGHVEDLFQLIIKQAESKDDPIIHFSGEITVGELTSRLQNLGFDAQQKIVYKTKEVEQFQPDTMQHLTDGRITSALFFSPRTASIFIKIIKTNKMAHLLTHIKAFCISHPTAQMIKGFNWGQITVASQPNQSKLLDLLR